MGEHAEAGDNTSPSSLSPDIMSAITAAVEKAVAKAVAKEVPIAVDAAMAKWNEKLEVLEKRCETAEAEVAQLKTELKQVAVMNAFHAVDRDVYSRKWNLIITGLPGIQSEPDSQTEIKVRDLANKNLKIPREENLLLAACHRLSQKANSPIIVKFVNLRDRNLFLKNAKELKNTGAKISISPDLPPILKDLRDEILKHRKDLPPHQKATSKIEYHKSWPYMTLQSNGNFFKPEFSTSKLLTSFYKTKNAAIQDIVNSTWEPLQSKSSA